MVTLISVIIGLVLFSIVKNSRIDMTSKRMLKMFVVYWIISIVLASIRILDIFEISFYTFILVYLGIISFSMGFLLVGRKRHNGMTFSKEDFSTQFEKIAKNQFYQIIMIIASVYIYSLLVIFFDRIMLYGTLYNVRTDFYSNELYGPFFQQVNAFVLRPLWFISLPVFSYQILYKRNLFCLVLAFYLIGYESLGGGRIGYIRIALGVVFLSYCVLQTFKRQKRKGIAIIVGSGALLFVLLSVITIARTEGIGGDGQTRQRGVETTLEHIVSYTACPIAAFDYSIEHDYTNLVGGYQYGKLTMTSVTSLINLFSSRIGYTLPTLPKSFGEQKQDVLIDIAPEHNWNALYTANLYYYMDFGFLGVIIFPFLFGMLISALITQLYRYRSITLLMIVSYCLWCMLYSVLDYGFGSPYDLLTLLILYFIGVRRKNCVTKLSCANDNV